MISVVVPTYNNGTQIVSIIENIENQNIKNIEIIIIDDCSMDDTCQKINALNKKSIRYYKNSKNLGTTKSRIIGIKKASGKYIAFLDDDDYWFPCKLSKQLSEIKQSNCDFVMCNYLVNNIIDQNKYE